jgi:Cu(I)/Ag(I) efflux system membrane fusion protein
MDESAATGLPNRVQIGAVVRGADASDSKVTLQHESVPEWSWPAMTMSFDVEDSSQVEGLQNGQLVDVVIEKFADGRHRVTEILPGPGLAEPATEETDHSGHDMEMN